MNSGSSGAAFRWRSTASRKERHSATSPLDPRHAKIRARELGLQHDGARHGPQDLGLVVEVVVERRSPDVELTCQPQQAEGAQPFLVDDPQGRLDYVVTANQGLRGAWHTDIMRPARYVTFIYCH